MCGIFGVVTSENSDMDSETYKRMMNKLFILSESRGKEASGFAFEDDKAINVHKTPLPASELVQTSIYKDNLDKLSKNKLRIGIGHSRLVTDGEEYHNYNNQPVVKEGMVVVHNGIIVNVSELWKKYDNKIRTTDLDSEIIPVIFSSSYEKQSFDFAVNNLFREIYGMTSIAILFEKLENLLLATNNGSLYYVSDVSGESLFFCSERQIVLNLITSLRLENRFSKEKIEHIEPNQALLLSTQNLEKQLLNISLDKGQKLKYNNIIKRKVPKSIVEKKPNLGLQDKSQKVYTPFSKSNIPNSFLLNFDKRQNYIHNLQRCKKCILPSTFPFIEFDDKGICNYCNNHKPINPNGAEALEKDLYELKDKNTNDYDCLIPLSGGRDSCYTLHYITKELGLKPLTFSYDWGMITDLARRNQSRLCGELGVEHILISADIRKKRTNIRKNVEAWLCNPHLGMVPIFMAGDKQYHYLVIS